MSNMNQETAETKAKATLYVHRCNWCGKLVTEEPTSFNLVKSVTIVCDECLDWSRSGFRKRRRNHVR